MNEQITDMIERGIQENFNGENTFPKWIAALASAGIERYYSDLVALKVTFYSIDGTMQVAQLPYPNPPVRGEGFSEKDVSEAVRASQRGEIIYPEFLDWVIKAGTVSYTVYLLGKQVHYLGAKGELHIEHFPQEAKND